LGHQLIGAFLEEGIVESITRARVGPRGFRTSYDTHVAFVGLLQKRLGPGVVEDLVLHGDYRSFRAAIKRMFLGSEQKTFEFLNTLRSVDAGATDALGNPDALREAIGMLQEADRAAIPHSPAPVHPRESRPTVVQTPEERAKLLDQTSAPHQPAPASKSPNGHAGQPDKPSRPRLGPKDFDDETPTPRIGPKSKKPTDFENEPTVVEHQDTSVDAGEINAPDVPRPSKGKVTTGATVVVADPAMIARARTGLRDAFLQLVRTGGIAPITIEGVAFGRVHASMSRDGVLTVLRSSIFNIDRIPGRGNLIHGAFEQAAIDAARASGARSVRVGVDTVINSKWAAELQSLGYQFETLPTAHGFTRVLIRTLPL
jgi:hypothetical protein